MNMNGTYKRKQNMQNGTISELYTDGKNHIVSLMVFLSQLKVLYKRDERTKLSLLNFLVKLITKRKSQINDFTIARQTFF